jgi:lysozyme family protein
MNRTAFDKRDFLRAGAVLPLIGIGSAVRAQNSKILGLEIPREILDILPVKPLNYLRIANSVIQLEREADRKGLPQSPLALGKGQSLADLQESLYQMALPRLVAIIDRSENVDAGLAENAGALLAELHQSQHELPEALRSLPLAFGATRTKALRMHAFLQAEPTAQQPAIIFQPGVPPLPETPVTEQPPQPEPETATSDPGQPPAAAEDRDKPLSRAKDFASLKNEYRRLYQKLEVRPQYAASANWHVQMMQKSRARYERVGSVTGVPWFFIAVTHGLEASFNFRAHLHNGDYPLSARTRQVPAGRPSVWLPPSDWESSAKDALRLLGYTGQSDWSLERTLYRLEAYNGLGYRRIGVPTPYLWSFSNQYERGKFVADGKFNHNAKSQQCGAAVMLKLLEGAGEIKLESAA